jgi:hypothetical protein
VDGLSDADVVDECLGGSVDWWVDGWMGGCLGGSVGGWDW